MVNQIPDEGHLSRATTRSRGNLGAFARAAKNVYSFARKGPRLEEKP